MTSQDTLIMDRLILLVLLSVTVSMVTGSCFRAMPTLGSDGFVCEHQGYKFQPGSEFRTPDCYNCVCGNGGFLSCCGVGSNAGVVDMPTPHGCKWVVEDCARRLVKIHDESQNCNSK